MPSFERFTKDMTPRKREPQVTIQRRGTLALNEAAHLALGSPDAVELLYDLEQRIVGLRTVDPGAAHAHKVRPLSSTASARFAISALAFTRFYDIDTTQSRRWAAYLDDGVLCIDLNDFGTPVTSNRARGPQ
jgi:hypothetical protein